MTFRAIIIGLLGAACLAFVMPWNDWGVRNTLLTGSYLPPILVVALLAFTAGINPRLGRHRLATSEISLILALMLSVGGLASVGLMRHFPAATVEPVLTLTDPAARARWTTPMTSEDIAALATERGALAKAALTAHDRNGDGHLDGDERRSLGLVLRDATTPLDVSALLALLPQHDHLRPVIPAHWTVVDATDPPQRGSLGWEQRVEAYRSGAAMEGRIAPGSMLDVRQANGAALRLVYTDGADALRALAAGYAVADPSSDARAAQLLATPIGATVDVDGEAWTLTRVSPPGIAWSAWLSALLSWSPLILAMIAGTLALAAIVRHQWVANERLPFPIAGVLSTLVDPMGTPGKTPLLHDKSFRIGALTTIIILTFDVLRSYGLVPFSLPLTLNLSHAAAGIQIIDNMPNRWDILNPHLYPSVVALAFLMTIEISGSLWGSFLGVSVIAAIFISEGIPVTGTDLDNGTVGGAAVLCLLTVWVGRHYYVNVLAAACGLRRDDEARAAAPWVWVLIAAIALMMMMLMQAEVGFFSALAVALITFGTTLVLARIVAESGIPYVSFGGQGRVGGIILTILGPSAGAAALLPLLLVGYIVGQGDRERLLPSVLHGLIVDQRSGGRNPHRLLLLIGISCIIVAVIAYLAMVLMGHFRGANLGDSWPTVTWRNAFAGAGAILVDDPTRAQQTMTSTWYAYAIGALVVMACGLMRLRFARWPLHPIGLIIIAGWVTKMCWASYFLGWLAKLLVTRYGGHALYSRLVPAVIGIIAGEALVIVACMVVGLVRFMLGYDPVTILLLPS